MKSVMNRRIATAILCLLLPTLAFSRPVDREVPGPGLDRVFVELAERIPGFGGYFFDTEGDLNVYLTSLVWSPAARTAFADVARNRPERSEQRWKRPAQIVIRRAGFDFPQLDTWRARITAALDASHAVLMMDTDEAANRVHIGVSEQTAVDRVLAVVDQTGVPRNAVFVEVVPHDSLMVSLNDYVRPLVGGLEINSSVGNCTLGVNVYYSNPAAGISTGTKGFFTNSHCTATEGATDGTVYSQGGSPIGYERWDPPFFTATENSRCASGWNCRWSDVAFVAYNAGVSRQQGAVAQTLFPGTGTDFGSLDINPDNPRFMLTQTHSPVVGVYLDKMGHASGWTSGPVTGTCVDRYVGSFGRLCQDRVQAKAVAGDSGSPVFQQTGTGTAAFAGIAWLTNGTTTYYFSNVTRIRYDMGSGITYTP